MEIINTLKHPGTVFRFFARALSSVVKIIAMADGRKREVEDCDSRSDDYDEVKDRFAQRVNGKTSGMPEYLWKLEDARKGNVKESNRKGKGRVYLKGDWSVERDGLMAEKVVCFLWEELVKSVSTVLP